MFLFFENKKILTEAGFMIKLETQSWSFFTDIVHKYLIEVNFVCTFASPET